MTKQSMMGNAIFAAAALEAGVRVVAGYPGTPSSEVIETIAKRVRLGSAKGVHVEWSTNEKAALELLAGASLCGARCLFTCKQVGLNVASDALMSLNYVGIKGGLVLFVADDPGPISSQTEQDTRRFAAFAKVPVLDPSTPEEGFAMMKAAFELSERYGTPVIVRPTTRVCHSSCSIDVQDSTQAAPLIEGFVKNPRQIIFPKRSYEAHGEVNERLRRIAQDFSTDEPWLSFSPIIEGAQLASGESAEVGAANTAKVLGIVASGISAAYVREALRMIESKKGGFEELPTYKLWQVGTSYPFPVQRADEFLEGISEFIVFEELDSVLEEELLKVLGVRALQGKFVPAIKGKLTGDVLERGENSVDDAYVRLCAFFGLDGAAMMGAMGATDEGKAKEGQQLEALTSSLPVRPPTLCAGCPHRASFFAVKKALGKQRAVYCGDIGCYTLGNAAPLHTTDTCLCMGAGITMAQGIAVCEEDAKALSFIGDSTFFASGMTGIANAVYNNHDVTICILDNSTTAMTGLQSHPGIGHTLMGEQKPGIDIAEVVSALGVMSVVRVDPFDFDQAVKVVEEALAFEGPSVVIFKSPCIQVSKPQVPLVVNTKRCIGCKKCITSIGCPALMFDYQAKGEKSGKRGQACIEPSLCNGCTLCMNVCPTHCIETVQSVSGNEVASC